MTFCTQKPNRPLSRYVDWFWFYEGLSPSHALERVLPDGSMELIFNLREEPRHTFDQREFRPLQSFRKSWFSGAHSKFLVIDTAPNSSMIGAHFKPGGAAMFLRCPASELRDTVLDLRQLWGGHAELVREELLEARGPAAKFAALERALLSRFRNVGSHAGVSHAMVRVMKAPEGIAVGELAEEAGLSHRQFIQRFTEQTGLTPKAFCRVQRFQRALRQARRDGPVDWADMALACGYYDQAHFIHDFREFCGMSPSHFLKESMEYPNFVPIRG